VSESQYKASCVVLFSVAAPATCG